MFDNIMPIIFAVSAITALGAFFGLVLSIAKIKLHVQRDPRIEEILTALPGANCGACGFPGCGGYASKIVEENADITLCPAGGSECVAKIACIMGVEAGSMVKKIARIHCNGGTVNAKDKFTYNGPISCAGAAQINSGFKMCEFGCLGMGDCIEACPFYAITIDERRIPIVDKDKCTGCGKCVSACPRKVISLEPANIDVYVMCRNLEKGPVTKQGCTAGCIGCQLCVNKACKLVFADNPLVESAIKVTNFLAVVDSSICTNCGKCGQICPQKVITLPTVV